MEYGPSRTPVPTDNNLIFSLPREDFKNLRPVGTGVLDGPKKQTIYNNLTPINTNLFVLCHYVKFIVFGKL